MKTFAYLVHKYGPESDIAKTSGDVYRVVFEQGDEAFEKWMDWEGLRGTAGIGAPRPGIIPNVFVMYIGESGRLRPVSLRLQDWELREWLRVAQDLLLATSATANLPGRPPQAHQKLTSYQDRASRSRS